jgi:hypothetical protein
VPFLFGGGAVDEDPLVFDQRALLAQGTMLSMAGPKDRGFRGYNAKDEQSPRHQKIRRRQAASFNMICFNYGPCLWSPR